MWKKAKRISDTIHYHPYNLVIGTREVHAHLIVSKNPLIMVQRTKLRGWTFNIILETRNEHIRIWERFTLSLRGTARTIKEAEQEATRVVHMLERQLWNDILIMVEHP